MKELLEQLIKELVDKPDEVFVTQIETERMVIYELHVGNGDYRGRLVAKRVKPAAKVVQAVGPVSYTHLTLPTICSV